MATQEVILHPSSVVAELKKNNISHVVWLPDSETNFMFQLLSHTADYPVGTNVSVSLREGHHLRPFVGDRLVAVPHTGIAHGH